MAATLGFVRIFWPTSAVEAITLTLLGVLIYVVGLRTGSVVGPPEVALLRRTRMPGAVRVAAWLAPAGSGSVETRGN